MNLVNNSLDLLYVTAIDHVLTMGEDVEARGLKFKECRFQHLILTNPRGRLITNPVRNVSRKFTMAEFLWIMCGKCGLQQIEFYNKRMRQFSDDGVMLHGAYGPRLRNWNGLDQLKNTVKKLKEDLYTRQAVIIILNPEKDLVEPTKDIPCNDLLQFMFRDGRLDLAAYVRSNDLNWGFPYDVFHWTMLQEIIACELGVPLGEYHHFVGSLHVYERDFEKMREVSRTFVLPSPMEPMPAGTNLGVLDRLALFEQELREYNKIDFTGIPEWWHDKLLWLKG